MDKAKNLRRNMTSQEKHIWFDFLKEYPVFGIGTGITTLEIANTKMLLIRCYGLSLSDQYWIKPNGLDLAWDDINFFYHSFIFPRTIIKQLIDGHAEKACQGWDQRKIRCGSSRFPFADRFFRVSDLFGKLLLGQTCLGSVVPQIFCECDRPFHADPSLSFLYYNEERYYLQ